MSTNGGPVEPGGQAEQEAHGSGPEEDGEEEPGDKVASVIFIFLVIIIFILLVIVTVIVIFLVIVIVIFLVLVIDIAILEVLPIFHVIV